MSDDRKSWDDWFLDMARVVAGRSRDPSTKVGAVIVRPNKTIAGIGYNGFPRGVNDEPERLANRDFKLAATIHAEQNAILNAEGPVRGCDLYVTPFQPCSNCASFIVQAGIRRVIVDQVGDIPDRWRDSFAISSTILDEGGVHVTTRVSPPVLKQLRVVIESPFAGDVAANIAYAKAAVRDSLLRGEAPIASHLLHTQDGILRDDLPEERTMGMEAGHAWIGRADLVAVYSDLGISRGMAAGINYADSIGVPVQVRRLANFRLSDRDAA